VSVAGLKLRQGHFEDTVVKALFKTTGPITRDSGVKVVELVKGDRW
jgi:hypothetical protein